jgi:glycosyltransferase involved in cell wall biosynthesis
VSLPTLICSNPASLAPDPARTVGVTMWESTRISAEAVERCNALRALIVPADPVAEWFRASGVTTPIRVVPLGIDLDAFHARGRVELGPDDPVVFGAAGRTAHGGVRKGLDEVTAAFLDAFPDEPRARLELKVWPDCTLTDPNDPRVAINREPLTTEALAGWYRGLAAFVSASRGEGWGLQPHQGMACGAPVIAPFWGGHTAYLTEASAYPVDFDLRPATGPIYGGLGDWCIPRHASLVEQMRRAFRDADERRAKGRAAAKRAAEFPWSRTAAGVRDVLVEFALP